MPLKDFGMKLSMYYDIFVEQFMSLFYLTSAKLNCLDIWILTIFQIPIKLDLKWRIDLPMLVQQHHVNQSNK